MSRARPLTSICKPIADIVAKYGKYNGWRKPEQLRLETYSVLNYREAERVAAAWDDLVVRAKAIAKLLPPDAQSANYELVLHPVKACANLAEMNIATGRSHVFAQHDRASINAEAVRARQIFRKDKDLTAYFNKRLAGGKWYHMMDQPRIGHTD